MYKKRGYHLVPIQIQNCAASLASSLAGSNTLKYIFITVFSNWTRGVCMGKLKISPHKRYMQILNSQIIKEIVKKETLQTAYLQKQGTTNKLVAHVT